MVHSRGRFSFLFGLSLFAAHALVAGTIKDLNPTPAVVRTGTFPGTPVAVALNSVGDIFVLTEEGQIHSLSGVLAVLTSVTLPAPPSTPVTITATDDGDVYVARQDGRIHRLTTGLGVLTTVTIPGTPVDLTVEPGTGSVFIGNSAGRIFKRTVALAPLGDVMVTGTPRAMRIDNVGTLYVATTTGGTTTIHRLTNSLTSLGTSTVAGTPVNITSDSSGHVILATTTGLRSLTSTATAAIAGTVIGVDVDDAGDVVVANDAGAVTVLNTSLTSPSTVATGLTPVADIGINVVAHIYIVGGTAAAPLPVLDVTTPMGLTFGDVTAGTTAGITLPITVSDAGPGDAAVTITSASAAFPLTGTTTSTLVMGASMTANVHFNAPLATLGDLSSVVTVSFTSGGSPGTPITRTFTGRSVARKLCVTPTSLSLPFGLVNTGTSRTLMLDVRNCGNLPLTISEISLSTTDPATTWNVSPLVPPAIAPLAPSVPIPVSVTLNVPSGLTADVPYAATIHITSNANVGPATQTVTAAGTGHVPVARIRIAPEYFDIDYRNVEIGFHFSRAVVIENTGDLALTFEVARVTDPNPADFALETDTGMFTIAPHDRHTFRETFQPRATGGKHVTLRVRNTNDATFTSQDLELHGVGTPPIPIDAALLLDRSGSMDESAGEIRKIEALRRAGILFTELLRDSVDYFGLTKYDHENENILPLGRIDLVRGTAHTLLDAIDDPLGLRPRGSTGIGGAMRTGSTQYALSPAVTPPDPGHKKVMVVLTDGHENLHPFIREVLDGDPSHPALFTQFPDLLAYSVGLGNDINAARLQEISNRGPGGFFRATGNLTGLSLFDLENFYFKVFADATGQTLVVDPTYSVDVGGSLDVPVGIINEDREALFFFIGELPERAYVFELVDPLGNVITSTSSIGGMSVQVKQINNWILFRVKFPDSALSTTYVGAWRFRIRIANPDEWRQAFIPRGGRQRMSFAASVASDYKLTASVGPGVVLNGERIHMRAALTNGSWPSPHATVHVTIERPDGTTAARDLFDDGVHGDDLPGDAVFGGDYEDTAITGIYGFLFHSDGTTERGELVSREAFRSQFVGKPKDDPLPCDPNPKPNGRHKGRRIGYFMGGLLFQEDFPIDSGLAFGFRYAQPATPRVDIESELLLSSPTDDAGRHGFLTQLNLLAKASLGGGSAIEPFVTAGAGWLQLRDFGPPLNRDGIVPFAGVGLDYHVRPRLDVRIDVRYFDVSSLHLGAKRHLSIFWGIDIGF